MSIFSRKISVSLPFAILVCFILLISALIYISMRMTSKSFFAEEGPFWLFVVGLVPGLVVALMQFMMSWGEFRQISKFTAMKIKGVLDSRDSEDYYGQIIGNAKDCIFVQGVTASRFLSDFADETSSRPSKKLLIDALQRGVRVRFLLPEEGFLSPEDKSEKYPLSVRILTALSAKFENIEIRYFSHHAIAAIVRVDDDVLVGPVFKNTLSRNTPAIHASASSSFVISYLNYFDEEWGKAREADRK